MTGMFEPLTQEELAAAPMAAPQQENWTPLPPPANVSVPPKFEGNGNLGSVGGVWEYRDNAGVLEGYVVRFDTEANGEATKTFRPCRYGRLRGRDGWQWRGWGDNRPLYGLPNIFARRAAPLLIVEDEKCADAAARIFPDFVATTPMNGAQSPAKTDWGPAKSRTVTIWPDHDGPGRDFAERVTQLCNEAGAASVRVVSVPSEFPEKWDLGDPIPESWDAAKLRGLLDGAVRHKSEVNKADPFPATTSSAWSSPDMSILTEGRLPPPELPLALFGPWIDWLETAAEVKNCPPDFVAVSLITIAATLIGNSRRAMPWSGWIEPCVLWGALVGPPSSGKSPGLDAVLDAQRKIEIEFANSYAETLRQHQGAVVVAKERRAVWEDSVKEAVKTGTPPPDLPEGAQEPERPRRPRIVVTAGCNQTFWQSCSPLATMMGWHRGFYSCGQTTCRSNGPSGP